MALGWGQDNYDGGWVNDQEAIASCARANAFLEWGATEAASLDSSELPPEFLSTLVEIKTLGKRIPYKNQGSAGFCCGAGTHGAAERTLVARIAKGDPFVWKETAFEVGYAGGRYDAGYSWAGDGSTGAATAAFVKNKGLCVRDKYDKYDLNNYLVDEARVWARKGLPAPVLAGAKQFPCEEIAKIKTWAEAKQAMAQGHFITVASSYGFNRKRDKNGVLTAWGRWLHCMLFGGYTQIDGVDHAHLINSWDDYFQGPEGKYPIGNDGGYVHWKTTEAMLAQGDSYAIIGTTGAKLDKRLLKWF